MARILGTHDAKVVPHNIWGGDASVRVYPVIPYDDSILLPLAAAAFLLAEKLPFSHSQ
jgi:hypothetical protein